MKHLQSFEEFQLSESIDLNKVKKLIDDNDGLEPEELAGLIASAFKISADKAEELVSDLEVSESAHPESLGAALRSKLPKMITSVKNEVDFKIYPKAKQLNDSALTGYLVNASDYLNKSLGALQRLGESSEVSESGGWNPAGNGRIDNNPHPFGKPRPNSDIKVFKDSIAFLKKAANLLKPYSNSNIKVAFGQEIYWASDIEDIISKVEYALDMIEQHG